MYLPTTLLLASLCSLALISTAQPVLRHKNLHMLHHHHNHGHQHAATELKVPRVEMQQPMMDVDAHKKMSENVDARDTVMPFSEAPEI